MTMIKRQWREEITAQGLVVESWAQGLLMGTLVIMACITVSSLRRQVLLHKLILAEQILALFSGTYCFASFRQYGWYVSSTAALLYCSYFLHNVVAWIKVRPFFVGQYPFFAQKVGRITQQGYIITLALTVPILVFQIFNDFRYNAAASNTYTHLRPYEFAFRDPWWLFTNVLLLHIIGKTYGVSIFHLIHSSPRLGILLLAIALSIIFTFVDLVATIMKGKLSDGPDGINPYWKISLIFKCLTDAIMLDDFATELRRIAPRDMTISRPVTGIDSSPSWNMQTPKIMSPEKVKKNSTRSGSVLQIEDAALYRPDSIV